MPELTIDLPESFQPRRHRDRVRRLVTDRAPGHVLTRIEDGTAHAAEILPGRATARLAPGTKAADLPAVAATLAGRGLTLAGVDLGSRIATVGRLNREQLAVREQIAGRLGCRPWEVEVVVGTRGTGQVTDVVVTRWPAGGVPAERARELWLEIAREVVGDRGWTRRMTGGRIEMHAEPVPDFPAVPAPWDLIAAAPWSRIFLGHDGRGRPVWGDMTATPHAMVTGRTGAGKSVGLELLLVGLLLRGWDLRVCEPVKRGLDFAHLRPFTTRWATTRPEVALVMTELASEIDRRLAVMAEHGAKRWDELDASVRDQHGIRPIVVVHDELESAAQEIDARKLVGQEKARAEAGGHAVATTRGLISRLLREARYVGIHVILSTQRWLTQTLGSESSNWRANAGLRLALGRMNLDTLKTSVVDVDGCTLAYERAHGGLADPDEDLTDAPEPVRGLGIAELDYLDPVALRVAWPGTSAEQTAVLLEHGVAEPGGPAPTDPDAAGYGPPPGWTPETVEVVLDAEPAELDLGGLTLDDLED